MSYNPVTSGNTAGYTGSVNSNVYLQTEYLVDRVGEEAAQKVNIFPLVWVQMLEGAQTMAGHFRTLDALSPAAAVTEGSALTVVAWSPEGVVITAGLDGLSIQESKTFNGISPDALDRIAGQIGSALARAIDVSLAALFPSLTGGTVGTTGASLVALDIIQAEAYLDKNFANGNRVGVVHPQQFAQLKKDIKAGNYGVEKVSIDAKGNDVITIGTTTIQKNALVPAMACNTDWAGAVFVEEALGCVVAKTPRVEILDIPGYDAYSIDGTVAFGTGIVRPTFGCVVRGSKTTL